MVEHATHALGDGEAKPQALFALLVARCLIQTTKLLKYLRLLGFRNAGSGIPDFYNETCVSAPATQQDPPFLGVAQRVGEKILDDPAQHLRVAVDPGERGYHHKIESAVFGHHSKLGTQWRKDVG